jgi:hypothetical protein
MAVQRNEHQTKEKSMLRRRFPTQATPTQVSQRTRITWTYEMRTILYRRFLEDCGPYQLWENRTTPPPGRKAFGSVVNHMARYLSHYAGYQLTPGAVASQVAWATTHQHDMGDKAQVRNFILNVAAALEVGFFTTADLPDYLGQDRPRHEPVRAPETTRQEVKQRPTYRIGRRIMPCPTN